jgi:APA family basic amino acid/polyamine antiporter
MIGSGVFLLPASLAPFGWSAMGGWLVTIAGTLCLAAAFAALAGAFPRAGGAHAYVREAFGREWAFVVAWSYWIGIWVGNAALAVAVVSNLTVILPGLAMPGAGAAASLAIVALLTAINYFSLRASGGLMRLTTLLKLVPLAAVLVIALVVFSRDGAAAVVSPPAGVTLPGVVATVTLTMWAMLGFESATLPADKVRDAERNVPRATLWGTALTGLVYLAVSAAMLLLVAPGTLATSDAPFADFTRPFIGPQAAALIGVFAAIAALGALNGWILMQAELPRAMALSGDFPMWFARVNRDGVPVNALLSSSLLVGLLLLANFSKSMNALFVFLLLLSTASILIGYLGGALALLKLRHRLGASATVVTLASVGALYAGFAIVAAGREAIGWGAVLLASGVPVLWAMRRQRTAGV